MRQDMLDLDRRLAEAAALIDRQQELVQAMRRRGLPAEAPLRLLSSMLRHFRMLEERRREQTLARRI